MKRILAACSIATLVVGAAACDNTTPSTKHAKAKATTSGGIVTSMTYTQSMDTGPCSHTPAQAECATVWTIAWRDTAGKQHTASVTETAYNRCLRRFPGGRYPACASR